MMSEIRFVAFISMITFLALTSIDYFLFGMRPTIIDSAKGKYSIQSPIEVYSTHPIVPSDLSSTAPDNYDENKGVGVTKINSVTDNIISIDIAECRAMYSHREFLSEDLSDPPPLLYSFPGSGNTWCRQLLDYATGVYSGSVYHDLSLMRVLPGERVCNRRVSVIKAHPHIQTFQILSAGTLLPGKCSSGGVSRFTRAVFLLRNPYHAIWSEFQRRRSGSHVGGVPRAGFDEEKWRSHRGFLSLKYKEMMAIEYPRLVQ